MSDIKVENLYQVLTLAKSLSYVDQNGEHCEAFWDIINDFFFNVDREGQQSTVHCKSGKDSLKRTDMGNIKGFIPKQSKKRSRLRKHYQKLSIFDSLRARTPFFILDQ